jgi:hypothetical protein
VIRRRLPSENRLGLVTLMGNKVWMMFISPVSAPVQNVARV